MAQELRRIRFTEDDLRPALVEYCQRSGIRWPAANIERLVLSDVPEKFVTVQFGAVNSEMHSRADAVVFTYEQTFAAIILLCRRQNIPIPRPVPKILRIDGGAMVLDINIHWVPGAKPAPAPSPASAPAPAAAPAPEAVPA